MSKEQKSNREKKKPKQDKAAKGSAAPTAYAQAKMSAKGFMK
ncbi:MAG: hypothetical protein RL274_1151 [Pseudomonadota bacterium]|jgi:hypothetical protein